MSTTSITVLLASATARLREDRGQTSAEVLGLVVIVSLIIAAIAGSGLAGNIADGLTGLVSEILGNGG